MNSNTTPPAEIIKCAALCHEANHAICTSFGDNRQKSWDETEQWQRDSSIKGVATVLDTPADEFSPSMLHDAWSKHKRDEGWSYGPVKDAETKEHPCLVPFESLPLGQQVKDRVFLAIVRTYFDL